MPASWIWTLGNVSFSCRHIRDRGSHERQLCEEGSTMLSFTLG
jgi:hypothetical protein